MGTTETILLGLVYFLPCLVGLVRNIDRGAAGVVLLNVLLGWTVIGWIIALIWASTGETAREARRRREAQEAAIALAARAGADMDDGMP